MRRTILIVDDHAGFRRWAGAPLATQGYAVLGEGRDGASAIGAVGTPQPDVVLPGLRLPGMDGVAVARSLTADGGAAAVVLTSSRDAADVGGRTAACGVCGLIAKADVSGASLDAVLATQRS